MFMPDPVADAARFLVGASLAIGLGGLLCVCYRRSARVDRLCLFMLPAAGLAVAALAFLYVIREPYNDWNAGRIAPGVGIARGLSPYQDAESGPILNTIYPPVSALVYMPAGLFRRPTAAILAGSLISLALFFTPWVALCALRRGAGSGRSPIVATLVFLSVCQLVMTTPMAVAFQIHADAPAIGFALLAMVLLDAARGDHPSPRRIGAVALFATLSVFSKQTLAPLLFVLPAWVALTHGRRRAALLIAGEVAFAGSAALASGLAFGPAPLLFNILEIPRRHPWLFDDPARGFLVLSMELLALAAPLLGSLTLLVVLDDRASVDESEPWTRRHGWALFAVAAACAAPTGLLGRIKVGGGPTSFAPSLTFLCAAVATRLLARYAWNRDHGRTGANQAIKVALLASFASPLLTLPARVQGHMSLVEPVGRNAQELAYRYARSHPGEAFFPWNPLSTLLAEGRADHFSYGLFDRELAGYPASDVHFRSALPPRLRVVCFPPNRQDEFALTYLPEFRRRVELPELPGWICYERQPSLGVNRATGETPR